MPRQARWTGDDLYWLLTETVTELCRRYPQYGASTIKGKKAYWKDKLRRGEVAMPSRPEASPTPEQPEDEVIKLHGLTPDIARQFAAQGFHIGFIKNADNEIEYTIPLPSARRNKVGGLEDFQPATPARIVPSKAKPAKRDHKILYVFGDAQIDYRRLQDGTMEPIHDERALSVGRMICKDIQPDEIINLGDTVDLAVLSRFSPDSDHFFRTLGPSFQRIHDYYAELRADSPWAKITEVDSNHNTRLKAFVLKYAPSMYGLKRAGETDEFPVLSYPFLANLGKLGVNWRGGYGADEYVYGLEYDKPPIIFKHGNSAVSNGSTAAKESKENPEVNVVRGHSHRMESFFRTTRSGQYLASIIVGASCRTTGEVPSYHSAVDDHGQVVKSQENWQQGVMVIHDYDGDYQFDHIPIRNGVAFYGGKEYRGDE